MLKRDVGRGIRRARVVQLLFLQSILAAGILYFVALSAGKARWLSLWTLAVPVGFAASYWMAYRAGERARSGGSWTPQSEIAESRRLVRRLGATIMVWIAGGAAVWYLA